MNEAARSVALYWDFENLHASLCEAQQEGYYTRPDNRFRAQEPLVDIQAVMDAAAAFGPVRINRAYCNWQFFGRYPRRAAAACGGPDADVSARQCHQERCGHPPQP